MATYCHITALHKFFISNGYPLASFEITVTKNENICMYTCVLKHLDKTIIVNGKNPIQFEQIAAKTLFESLIIESFPSQGLSLLLFNKIIELKRLCYQYQLPNPSFTFLQFPFDENKSIFVVIIKMYENQRITTLDNPSLGQVKAVSDMILAVQAILHSLEILENSVPNFQIPNPNPCVMQNENNLNLFVAQSKNQLIPSNDCVNNSLFNFKNPLNASIQATIPNYIRN